MQISGNLIDILKGKIFPATIEVKKGKIVSIKKEDKEYQNYILPGFIDSHIHIESSMLIPSEFARIASVHGTTAVVTDPHEIANVLGKDGVDFMIDNAKKVPFNFYFSCPSCVPATPFETSGAKIGLTETDELLSRDEVKYLGEMMNFPGVIHDDKEVLEKLKLAKKYNKKIDGHCPALGGKELKKYIESGISTDHECFTKEEALEKLKLGMKIQIREGSSAKNFETLVDLINDYYEKCMFCSDDKHPDDLIEGHINQLVVRAIAKGIDLMKVLRVACVNPVEHYNLDCGLLQEGDDADFIEVSDITNFKILRTFIKGHLVSKNGNPEIERVEEKPINKFLARKKKLKDFVIDYKKQETIPVIEAIDGQLITNRLDLEPKVKNQEIIQDVERDILKIAVINRYEDKKPAVAFIKNFGLKHGALASSVAHDSHNIVAVGTSDEELCKAVNLVIENKGGVVAVSNKLKKEIVLPLSVAGLMSELNYEEVAKRYTLVDKMAKDMGSTLQAPFMTLSFMALLVIPSLKISDKGLFDGNKFEFVNW